MKLSFRAIKESLINSISTIGTIIFTNERNLYIVGSNGQKLKISDLIVVESEDELNSLTEKIQNKLYLTKDNYKIYIWNGSIFKPITDGSNSKKRETIAPLKGQSSFTVPFSFNTGGSLKIYRNGVFQDLNIDYTEDQSTNSILLKTPTDDDEIFTLIVD
ncbi:hypothetical protein Goe21_02140 [Bacillus phage vB_BsuM-Goe21]|nr:hypothetical protein Goe21_02140 [Bacillus phage vB_BsuM-Goe21]